MILRLSFFEMSGECTAEAEMHIDNRGWDPITQKRNRVAGRGVHRVGGTATGHSLLRIAGLSKRA
jgi:hypothetical protein